jgi:hypothetical protein
MEFVFHCILCGGPIPETRVRRGGCTCSREHQQEYKRRKRKVRKISLRGDHCRACGRAFKKRGEPQIPPKGESSLHGHAPRGRGAVRKAPDSLLMVPGSPN